MQFSYKVQSVTGEILEGRIDSNNEKGAVTILHAKGYTIVSLVQLGGNIMEIDVMGIFNRPSSKDLAVFTRQLATLIDADMPILESLKTLALQTEKPSFKKIIENIARYVESGSSLSEALNNYPRLFTAFFVNLVRSGEASGKLHDSLLYLANHIERNQELNSKIKGAMAYPAFIVFALVIVAFIMAVWVLPNLLAIFDEVGVTDLPISTRILIAITNFVNKFYYLIIFGTISIISYLYYYIRTPKGREWFDDLKIELPYFGPIIRNFYVARISESLATLIKAGIPILDSLVITSNIVNNNNYKKIILSATESIKQGDTIADSFKNHPEIPPLLSSMISIGEKTGKLSAMLEHVAKFYNNESENAIQSISQLIEPIMVLILGFAVAVLVSSILLPMYNLVGVV